MSHRFYLIIVASRSLICSFVEVPDKISRSRMITFFGRTFCNASIAQRYVKCYPPPFKRLLNFWYNNCPITVYLKYGCTLRSAVTLLRATKMFVDEKVLASWATLFASITFCTNNVTTIADRLRVLFGRKIIIIVVSVRRHLPRRFSRFLISFFCTTDGIFPRVYCFAFRKHLTCCARVFNFIVTTAVL